MTEHVMIDLETLTLKSRFPARLSIGAVKFNPYGDPNQDIPNTAKFHVAVDPQF